MGENWIVGNKPEKEGAYWVTLKEGKVVTMRYISNRWHYHGYFPSKPDDAFIIAYMPFVKPAPYNPDKIGHADDYYIRVIRANGDTTIFAKQLLPINWSKIGYSSKEKAMNALKRLHREEIKEGYSDDSVYDIITGDSRCVYSTKEDVK